MSEIVYEVPFNSDYDYTFYVDFKEWIPLFEGLIYVHIGDGTSPDITETIDEQGHSTYTGGKGGYLYGKYADGYWQDIGFVSDYEAAKKYYADHGIQTDMTYEDWVNYLMAVPNNAAQARLWAIGLTTGEYSSGNSSREQANRSMIWAVGSGTDTDDGSPTNNSKHWAEISRSYADGKDLNGDTVHDREEDNAKYYKEQAGNSADKSQEWAISPDPVETIDGVTYESSRTYAMNCGQQIDERIEIMREATDAANAAADKLENMSTTTTTLPYTSPATSDVRTESGHYVIDFGIPQGEPDYLATSVVDDVNESGIVFDWAADREALSAKTIYMDAFDPAPVTIYDYVQFATNQQIEDLFE